MVVLAQTETEVLEELVGDSEEGMAGELELLLDGVEDVPLGVLRGREEGGGGGHWGSGEEEKEEDEGRDGERAIWRERLGTREYGTWPYDIVFT